jgi:hypothetical protein
MYSQKKLEIYRARIEIHSAEWKDPGDLEKERKGFSKKKIFFPYSQF